MATRSREHGNDVRDDANDHAKGDASTSASTLLRSAPDATRIRRSEERTLVIDHEPALPATEFLSDLDADTDAIPDLEIGAVLKDRFVIEQVLGRGGMGVVYLARDLRKEETDDRDPYIAVKVLSEDFRRDPRMVVALQRESRKAQTLAHPAIATVYDFDRDGDLVYLTMEVLEGKPLDEVIKANPSGLEPANAFAINRGLCLGLAYAHNKNIIHSDFKPGNVFLTDDERTKILDFGIARAAPASAFGNGPSRKYSHTQKNPIEAVDEADFDAGQLGALTPAYASCEMFEGADPHPADDVYALAIVLYQLLTGLHPFKGAPATTARDQGMTPAPIPGLKRRQWKALQRGLAFAREARSQHAAEFLADVEGSPKLRLALAASVLLLGVMGGYLAFDQAQQARVARPDVAFAALPQETRIAFRSLLDDGAQFVGFDDLASGLSSYREAYLLHPRNPEALQRIDVLVAQLVKRAMASGDARSQQVLLANLEVLAAEDDFLRSHANLRDALNTLGGD